MGLVDSSAPFPQPLEDHWPIEVAFAAFPPLHVHTSQARSPLLTKAHHSGNLSAFPYS